MPPAAPEVVPQTSSGELYIYKVQINPRTVGFMIFYIYIQKRTLSGPHFSTFLEMQCFCDIMLEPLCSYTCDDIAGDPHRLSDFLRGCQRMSREPWRFPGKRRRKYRHSVCIYIYIASLPGRGGQGKKRNIYIYNYYLLLYIISIVCSSWGF